MNPEINAMLAGVREGDVHVIARVLTLVENSLAGADGLLLGLTPRATVPVIGFTGPPGAGKSTLINALIAKWTGAGKRIAILAIDPTSPFNFGSLLGDRLRMAEHFLNPNVFIRSVATRGSLGGLSEKVIELIDVLRSANFDLIIVETVGVGQSEVEVAGLADTTVVVVVPEAGDEIQTMKSGIMEIADIFVVNKADREGADTLVHTLMQLTAHTRSNGWQVPVIKTAATLQQGIDQLTDAIQSHGSDQSLNEKKVHLLTEKAYRLIRQERMKGIRKDQLYQAVESAIRQPEFNLYRFILEYQTR